MMSDGNACVLCCIVVHGKKAVKKLFCSEQDFQASNIYKYTGVVAFYNDTNFSIQC